jgi:hypothetical protein
MCAAGTVIDSEVVLILADHRPIALVSILYPSEPFSELSPICSSRAPPSFS